MQRERSRFPTCSNITAMTSKLGRTENNLHTNDCFRGGGGLPFSFLITPKCMKKAKTATARQQESRSLPTRLHDDSNQVVTGNNQN